MNRAVAGVSLIIILALPVMRQALERVMVAHMLVQIPLLAAAGALVASGVSPAWRLRIVPWNRRGVSGILMALIVSSWWMVPRALDSVLAHPTMELTKFASLPLLVGAPLAMSWRELGGLGQGFVIANVLPMWAVVGWLYLAAPVRVCNFYLVEQQVVAGAGLLWTTLVLAAAAGLQAFRSRPDMVPPVRFLDE